MKKWIGVFLLVGLMSSPAKADEDDSAIAMACKGMDPCVTDLRLTTSGFPKVLYTCIFIENYCGFTNSQTEAYIPAKAHLCSSRNFHSVCDDMLKALHDELNKQGMDDSQGGQNSQ